MIPTLQNYLRTRLKNRKVTMTVRISAPTEKVRAYGRVEKLDVYKRQPEPRLHLRIDKHLYMERPQPEHLHPGKLRKRHLDVYKRQPRILSVALPHASISQGCT